MNTFWMGVASRDHVLAGVKGGFCQLCHGRASPLERLKPGDQIVYYSPSESMRGGAAVQAFTAAGEVLQGEPRQVELGNGFKPYRRDARFFAATEAPIKPLLKLLSFTRDQPNWGYSFRRGAFRIEPNDFRVIARAMGVTNEVEACENSKG